VLHLADAERQHDVADAANQCERRDSGDEQHGAPPVVTRRPKAKEELDDSAHELQPPHLDLVPGRDRDDEARASVCSAAAAEIIASSFPSLSRMMVERTRGECHAPRCIAYA